MRSSFRAGALMTTFLTLSRRCAAAFVASVKKPVDSITISTPAEPQGIWPGSRSLNTCTSRPSTAMPSSVARTSRSQGP